jgi:hypothetical protein
MAVVVEDPLIASMAIEHPLPLHESSRRLRALRVLPDDPFFADRSPATCARDGVVCLPNEAALTTWIAHRSHRALAPLFAGLVEISGGAMSAASMWHIVGSAIVSAATQVPLLAGSSELTSMRRSQAVLDALVGFGLPVRDRMRSRDGKVLRN